jgi:hypothetical protein
MKNCSVSNLYRESAYMNHDNPLRSVITDYVAGVRFATGVGIILFAVITNPVFGRIHPTIEWLPIFLYC